MLNAFAEALIMHNFSLPQELYGVAHVGVVAQQKNIVIGNARLLLCCQILVEVCYGVTGGLERCRIKRNTVGIHRVNSGRVVGKVRRKAAGLDFLNGKIARKLVHNGAYHFHMPKFLGAQRSIGNVPMYQI